jgi:MoxR-like ATPase
MNDKAAIDQPRLHAVGGPDEVRRTFETALFEVKRRIVGQETMLERIFVALLADGHVLLEGVPGLAKTMTIKTVADVLGGTFKRIQFTPDLVPSDLVGTRIYRPDSGQFDTELGPVFCNFLLADEINRAPAKVQSALLEVMQERQVTIGPQTFEAPHPFLVLATQNPIESEGTYPLPEAQVDRFMFKVLIDYPSASEEAEVVDRSLEPPAEVEKVLSTDQLTESQRASAEIFVDRAVNEYAVALCAATRDPAKFGIGDIARFIEYGASPRGSIYLIHAGRALALLRGRGYVLPEDVSSLAHDVLRHRLVLTYEALAEGIDANALLDRVLEAVEAPAVTLSRTEAAA